MVGRSWSFSHKVFKANYYYGLFYNWAGTFLVLVRFLYGLMRVFEDIAPCIELVYCLLFIIDFYCWGNCSVSELLLGVVIL